MTVKELMEILSKFDEDTKVVVECDDCEDKWYEVSEDDSEVVEDTLVLRVIY